MEPMIKKIEPIEVLYARATGNYMKSAEVAWTELTKYLEKKAIDPAKVRAIGISHDDPQTTDEDKLRYDACVPAADNMQLEESVKKQTIAGGTYAIFTHYGPYENLYKLYGKIYQEWLPTSGKKLRPVPMFEDYVICEMKEKNSSKWKTDIYVPIEE